jgi:glutamate-5-semialdehyde dehydrogenase
MTRELAIKVKSTAAVLAASPVSVRDAVLETAAAKLTDNLNMLISANDTDITAGKEAGLSEALIDRLRLTPARVEGMANGLRQLAQSADPIGGSDGSVRRPNGLIVETVRVPLGTVGIIYESRPNVTIDAAGLCVKSGNTAVLRGGKEAIHSNCALIDLFRSSLAENGLPDDCVGLVTDTSRQSAADMMGLSGILDVLIPRGGAGLIRTVVENARVPVIETGVGNVHIFIDASADIENALDIIDNAKRSRSSVCNAVETVLVHASIAKTILPALAERLDNVQLRGCPVCVSLLSERCTPASEADYKTEFGDLILAVKVVGNIYEAVAHIARYGSGHTESILTNDYTSAQRFIQSVDAAAVMVNASTRFTDGECFGLGAEIGISTQKLHARGPMGLKALTTIKYVVRGSGQIR